MVLSYRGHFQGLDEAKCKKHANTLPSEIMAKRHGKTMYWWKRPDVC